MKKKILIVLLAAFIIIQFFHPAENKSSEILATDITKVATVSDSVLGILKVACYDCHSNNTRYPWYNNIQPVAWWLNNHVKEGKQRLNFSEFGSYDSTKAAKKFKGIAREIQSGDMPLSSYTLIHRDAILADAKKALVVNWAKHANISTATN